jgi:regulatory protein
MDHLARREHTEAELKAKLAAKGYDPMMIGEAVAELRAHGLQSDDRFAANYIASQAGRGKGPVFMLAELRKRGIERELAESAIEAFGANWMAAARAARVKRFGEALPEGRIEVARQTRFLLQRGFTAEQSMAAVGDDDLED